MIRKYDNDIVFFQFPGCARDRSHGLAPERQSGYMGIIVPDRLNALLHYFKYLERRAVPEIADVSFERHAEEKDLCLARTESSSTQGLDRFVDDKIGHVLVDTSR